MEESRPKDTKDVFNLFKLSNINYKDIDIASAISTLSVLLSVFNQIPKDTPEFFANKHIRNHYVNASDLRKDIVQEYNFKDILPMHENNPYGQILSDGHLEINLQFKNDSKSQTNSLADNLNEQLNHLPKTNNLVYHKKWNYITLTELLDIKKNNPDEFKDYLKYVNNQLAACKNLGYLCDKNQTIDINSSKIPIALKNLYWEKGKACSNSSQMLQNFIPHENSTVVEKLLAKDFVNITTHNDAFACGTLGKDCSYSHVISPWFVNNKPLNIGGSSSGVGGMVAARITTVGVGSDTGGSIRSPAAFGGTVALKTSYGSISRHGMIELNSELDTVGIMGATVQDVRYMFNLLKGADSKDNTLKIVNIKRPIKKVIGVLDDHMFDELGLRSQVNKIKNYLTQQGYSFVNITVKFIEYALPIYLLLTMSNLASANHKYNGILYGNHKKYSDPIVESRDNLFNSSVKKRILVGKYFTNNDNKSIDKSEGHDNYSRTARQIMYLMSLALQDQFKQIDYIMSVLCGRAPEYQASYKSTKSVREEDLIDKYTIYVNLACMCSVFIPVCLKNGGPVGVIFNAPYGTDEQLLDFAEPIDNLFQFYKNHSPISITA